MLVSFELSQTKDFQLALWANYNISLQIVSGHKIDQPWHIINMHNFQF